MLNTFRRGNQPNDKRPPYLVEQLGQSNTGHDRDIGSLDAAIGEIDASRGFRRAADADQNDVGLIKVARYLTVVMHHREIQRFDAFEIVGVEHMLSANAARQTNVEIGLKHLENGIEDIDARNCHVATGSLEPSRNLRINQRVEDNARSAFNLLDRPVQLARRTN